MQKPSQIDPKSIKNRYFCRYGGLPGPPWASLGPPVEKSIPFSVNSPPVLAPIGTSFWHIFALCGVFVTVLFSRPFFGRFRYPFWEHFRCFLDDFMSPFGVFFLYFSFEIPKCLSVFGLHWRGWIACAAFQRDICIHVMFMIRSPFFSQCRHGSIVCGFLVFDSETSVFFLKQMSREKATVFFFRWFLGFL